MSQMLDRQPAGLYVQTPDSQQIAFPLKHTEVSAKVAGNLSRVEVTQTFENPFTTTLEAVYIFPLPDEAAVDEMLIKIGDRTIKGHIKQREEAQQIYQQAKEQGRTAGLLEQERDNIFTQSLANIQPGEQIDVIIRYSASLQFEGGNYEFVFPMVVGPRYIPGTPIGENAVGSGSAPGPMSQNQDTDLVPDATRLNAPILPAGTRSGHDINMTVEIDAGVNIQAVRSPSHQLQISHEGQQVRVGLVGSDTIPNKDFILRYQVASKTTQSTLVTQSDDKGGHFALYLIPALDYAPEQIVPKDVVFLIDTSGSQMGHPLGQCQELMRRFIQGLNPNDTFSIINFANTTQHLSPVPLPNTPNNQSRAIAYINQLTAGGGTEMLQGIQTVLNFPLTDPGRLRSIVLLTDGYIGNDNQILAEVQRHLKPGNRLYSFGAGSSVNRFLLNRIAEIGRGISRVIRHDEAPDETVERFFRQINNPVLTNIQVTWEGEGESPVVYPAIAPDLFAEQPLVLFGRKADAVAGTLQVSGIPAGGTLYQQRFEVNFERGGNPAVAQLWGRSRIKAVMNQMVRGETKSGVEAVTQTAIAYQLLCQYTAFVAVSDEVRGDHPEASVSVQVPVEMPEEMSYEGIFGSIQHLGSVDAGYAPSPPQLNRAISPKLKMSIRRALYANLLNERGEYQGTEVPEEPRRTHKPQSPPSMPQRSFLDMDKMRSQIQGESSDSGDADISDINDVQFSPESLPEAEDESLSVREFEVRPQLEAPSESVKLTFQAPKPAMPPQRLKLVSVTGLDAEAIALLTEHLQAVQLPPGVSGELVWELRITNGQVKQVILDEEESSGDDPEVAEAIRRSLFTWRAELSLSTTVLLRVRISA
ncbi:VIT domain-containing protein [Laspinema olomoucense]|uniref:VIT domain-containing protein n=1 Tax=Laspinema olomoucense TaxID=3231600 RepID=UPI0021BAC89D|nr:VIT domain-containing protein [Laspinema sp. D3a]MCT7990120.1 after-VIT domain-containing protein [Laspinema sp. D3a]